METFEISLSYDPASLGIGIVIGLVLGALLGIFITLMHY